MASNFSAPAPQLQLMSEKPLEPNLMLNSFPSSAELSKRQMNLNYGLNSFAKNARSNHLLLNPSNKNPMN